VPPATRSLGIGAPRDTPREVIGKLNEEINRGLADPSIIARVSQLGGTVLPGSSDQFKQLIADETRKWGKVVGLAGTRID
jgi:tripartite-type tricarboxylate transporter receptor subunit TctC